MNAQKTWKTIPDINIFPCEQKFDCWPIMMTLALTIALFFQDDQVHVQNISTFYHVKNLRFKNLSGADWLKQTPRQLASVGNSK